MERVGKGGCHFPFVLTKYLRLLVLGTMRHLDVNLSKKCKNLQCNNLEIAKFQLIFNPNVFKN